MSVSAYGFLVLLSVIPCSVCNMHCVVCGPTQSAKSDCMENADQVTNCSATTHGCYVSHAKMGPKNGAHKDNFYVVKKCYFDKQPDKVNACWDDEITTNAGDTLNATTCICTGDLCNNGTLEDIQNRLAPTVATSTVSSVFVSTTSTGSDLSAYSLEIMLIAVLATLQLV